MQRRPKQHLLHFSTRDFLPAHTCFSILYAKSTLLFFSALPYTHAQAYVQLLNSPSPWLFCISVIRSIDRSTVGHFIFLSLVCVCVCLSVFEWADEVAAASRQLLHRLYHGSLNAFHGLLPVTQLHPAVFSAHLHLHNQILCNCIPLIFISDSAITLTQTRLSIL